MTEHVNATGGPLELHTGRVLAARERAKGLDTDEPRTAAQIEQGQLVQLPDAQPEAASRRRKNTETEEAG